MSMYKVWASYKPTADAANFVGDKGDIFYTDDGKLKISDGIQAGGIAITTDSTVDMSALTQSIEPNDNETTQGKLKLMLIIN